MDEKISVIIPVFNAAQYVTQAVESALEQLETGEVILIEDHSPDDSLQVCQRLAKTYEKVRLLQHPGGVNRGAAPSRNLGMVESGFPYIAFLDADDYYLPGRFTIPAEIFSMHPACDGVYEAVGIHFEDEIARQRWSESTMAHVRLTTMNSAIAPEELFKKLIKGGSGHIHLNGLVIKRSLLELCGYMNEDIADTLHEDTDFVLKTAAVGKLYPGRINEPCAVRRVHADNRVSAPRSPELIYRDKMRLRKATYRWCKENGLKNQRLLAFKRMINERVMNQPDPHNRLKALPPSTRKAWLLSTWPFVEPSVMLERTFWYELGSSTWGILRNDLLHLDN